MIEVDTRMLGGTQQLKAHGGSRKTWQKEIKGGDEKERLMTFWNPSYRAEG